MDLHVPSLRSSTQKLIASSLLHVSSFVQGFPVGRALKDACSAFPKLCIFAELRIYNPQIAEFLSKTLFSTSSEFCNQISGNVFREALCSSFRITELTTKNISSNLL